MLLAINIGNTNVILGLYRESKLLSTRRLTTRPAITSDECSILVQELVGNSRVKNITGVVLSSVVPSLTSSFEAMARSFLHLKPLTVSHKINTGIEILYHDPSQVGSDRIANAVAAYTKFGGPIIALDVGTATTFDVISKEGKYLGGVIAPGLKTSADHLVRVGARLPQVELRFPQKVIGQTTETSIQSGVLYGTLGQIKEIIQRIRRELGDGRMRVVATGGLLPLIADDLKGVRKEEHLTLEGLRILYERNRE
ncbi:type III pantothenate kinase [candidate division TA06 bacterium]|nr:type III pantothenate kinase [candidate division TA06 bacterium]